MSLSLTKLKTERDLKKNNKVILIYLTGRFNWISDLLSLKLITHLEDFSN